MGIFLVFFPEKQHQQHYILKRTNSSHIFTKTQSTISVCILLIFLTLLLFTLSSFEPNDVVSSHRRFLSQNTPNIKPPNSPALQGLGTLYVRGTSVKDGLVICHVISSVTTDELKLFVRTFLRSGLPSKSDLVFVFNSISTIDSFDYVIREEIDTFLKLIIQYRENLGNGSQIVDFFSGFDPTRFVKPGQDSDRGEPIWGKRVKTETNNNNNNSSFGDVASELTRLSYGSVVGFGIWELDPENSLSGFLDWVPMGLRRWACYPMILGRVKRKFKRVMLVDAKEVLLLGDPLGRIKSHSAESVIFSSTMEQKHGRKVNKLNKSHRKVIDPTLILGRERGVRRLSAAMLTEIVRSTTRQHHKRNSLTESALLSQLASNEFLQKSIKFITTESIPDPSQLSRVELANMTVVRSGNSNLDIGLVIMKHICSFPIESSVYTEC
ncbi:uncharacterized protein LOC143561745 [Bidens hawaiensis]|uniref:uncharacterized protein LOC143561745 n=1 Tax=Bidens hawaiensis TaxID=980011 RepID=UPI00404A0AEA